MSGHNKWSKIKHKKAASDSKKSQVFSKLIKLIQVESKKAGGDVNSPSLKAAIEKAKRENVPKDNIERAVSKGKSGEGGNLENALYESYGPGGAALIIEVLTDNKNRSAMEVKQILSKQGFTISAPGSASWAYEKTGSEWLPKTFVKLSGDDQISLAELVEELDEAEDVQAVFHNAELE